MITSERLAATEKMLASRNPTRACRGCGTGHYVLSRSRCGAGAVAPWRCEDCGRVNLTPCTAVPS